MFEGSEIKVPEYIRRQAIERAIVTKLIESILQAGCLVTIDNGVDPPIGAHINASRALEMMFKADEEKVLIIVPGSLRVLGWIQLVYGNDGYDVISDYTAKVEYILAAALDYAEQLETPMATISDHCSYVVVIGNPVSGFKVAGPFSSESDANLCADRLSILYPAYVTNLITIQKDNLS